MKVTFCAYDRPNNLAGGPNAWLRRLLASLKAKGVNIKVLFIISTGDVSECTTIHAIEDLGISYEYVYWKERPYTEDKIDWILKHIRADPPDVFVPNLMVAAYYAAKWVKKAGIPTVGILHSDDVFHHALIDEFVAGSEDFALTSIVAVSKSLGNQVSSRNKNQLLIHRLPYGALIPIQKANEPVNVIRIIYVGRLVEPQKRISALARAFCHVVREIPGTEAVIYGDGPEVEKITAIIETNGKDVPVRFVGAIDNKKVQEEMQKAHIFVLLSDYEGLPIALMEAMACGLVPVCLREKSGIEELIRHNENGLIVENRENSFIDGIRRLKQEEGLWNRLSINAIRTIEEEYSHEVCADKWINFLQKLSYYKRHPSRTIKIPDRIVLPPLNHGLAREDSRKANVRKPSLFKKIKNKLRLRIRIAQIISSFKKNSS